MSETRKIAAILVADVVGYSRLAGTDEDRTLARLRALRSDLIDRRVSVTAADPLRTFGSGRSFVLVCAEGDWRYERDP